MLLPASLGPDGYHCFQSSSNDNSVHATGKDAYYLSEVESQSHCPLLSAFPTLPHRPLPYSTLPSLPHPPPFPSGKLKGDSNPVPPFSKEREGPGRF